MITGITTFPTVIVAPMMTIPVSMDPNPGSARTSVPIMTPPSAISSASSGPARRITSAASGVISANITTGAVVSSPADAEPMPRSAMISGRTGVSAMIGARRLRAATRMPTSTSHGADRLIIPPTPSAGPDPRS